MTDETDAQRIARIQSAIDQGLYPSNRIKPDMAFLLSMLERPGDIANANAKLERFISEMPLPAREKQLAKEGARKATPEQAALILARFERAAALMRGLIQGDADER